MLRFAGSVALALAATTAGAQQIACGGTYTVQRGDTLHRIAVRAYGPDATYMTLWRHNRDRSPGRDPSLIEVGQVLEVPCLGADGEPLAASATDTPAPQAATLANAAPGQGAEATPAAAPPDAAPPDAAASGPAPSSVAPEGSAQAEASAAQPVETVAATAQEQHSAPVFVERPPAAADPVQAGRGAADAVVAADARDVETPPSGATRDAAAPRDVADEAAAPQPAGVAQPAADPDVGSLTAIGPDAIAMQPLTTPPDPAQTTLASPAAPPAAAETATTPPAALQTAADRPAAAVAARALASVDADADAGAAMSLPHIRPDCLMERGVALCEGLLWSEPLLESAITHFAAVGAAPLSLETVAAMTLCLPEGLPHSAVTLGQMGLVIARRPGGEGCMRAVAAGEVDLAAVLAPDAEAALRDPVLAAALVERVELTQVVALRAVAPQAAAGALEALDAGLAALRAGGEWFAVVDAALAGP